jgi:hypothetical protein
LRKRKERERERERKFGEDLLWLNSTNVKLSETHFNPFSWTSDKCVNALE